MAQEMLVGRLLLDLIPIASSSASEEEVVRHFSKTISEIFGIDNVSITNLYGAQQRGALVDYILNTKKAYKDNQLSEYSSFPELIAYRNRGFRSCAIVPIIADGKVVSVLELLSASENKFSDDLISSLEFATPMMGFALMYKYESSKSVKVATYFNASFASTVPQFLLSGEGRIIKYNRAFERLFSNEATEGVRLSDVMQVDTKQLSMARDVGVKVSLEIDGAMRLYKLTSSQVSERLLHITMQDLTDGEQLRAILESMGQGAYSGLIYLDRSMNVINATESIRRVIGYQSSLLLGKNLLSLMRDNDKVDFSDRISKLEQSTKAEGYTSLLNEGLVPVMVRYVLTKWLGGYIMVFTDAEAEQYIRNIRDSFNDFMIGSSDMVITVDELGMITGCNMPTEQTLGYAKQELLGKELKMLYSDPATLERDITHVRNGTKIDLSSIDLTAKDGRAVPATQAVRLFKDIDGNANYMVVIKELESKRKIDDLQSDLAANVQKLKNLESTSELKSLFINNISHELKSPLTSIHGFAKLLLSPEFGKLSDEQRDYITTIDFEAGRLLSIIQQVLDASKLEANKVKLQLVKEVDLKELGENSSIKLLQEDAERKGLSFAWSTAYDVPPIEVDKDRLTQVFVNLISNAIKFTEKGGITVKISRPSKKKVKCEVIDTGTGISEEERKKLMRFREFYQVGSKSLIKKEQSGTGLGLTITHDIIKLHHGKIGITSELGRGSNFWFLLPVSQPRPAVKPNAQ